MPISIIIPTKDRPVGLQRAVGSAMAALPRGGEVVVVDDGCRTAAAQLLSDHERLRVVLNDGPRFGPSAARNFGVGVARHDLVLFLDDDDELLPGYPARILEVARRQPDVAFGTGRRANASRRQTVRRPGRHDAASPLRFRLYGAGGLWVRKSDFCEVGGFCESLMVGEDIEFCIRLAKALRPMWFDPEPSYKTGTVVGGGADVGSVQGRIGARSRLECYELVLDMHGEFLRSHAPQRWRKYRFRVAKLRLKAAFEERFR